MCARKTKAEKRRFKNRSTFFGDKFTDEILAAKTIIWNQAENKYGIKISDALKILCEPLIEKIIPDNFSRKHEVSLRQTFYSLGMTAWNCCTATGSPELALAMAGGLALQLETNAIDRNMLDKYFTFLIERKFKLYPDIKAIIISFELSYHDNDWNLRVHSQF